MNVLLIMADELSTWGLGCYGGYNDAYGGAVVPQTPHLDALAARGTLFQTAYTPGPMCVPARAHADQARLVEELGGREKLLGAPQWNFTPADSR